MRQNVAPCLDACNWRKLTSAEVDDFKIVRTVLKVHKRRRKRQINGFNFRGDQLLRTFHVFKKFVKYKLGSPEPVELDLTARG